MILNFNKNEHAVHSYAASPLTISDRILAFFMLLHIGKNGRLLVNYDRGNRCHQQWRC